jgi:hypothetical protein
MRPLFLALGAFLMTAAAAEPIDGQEKKDPGLKAPFDQYVKVEGVTAKGDPFVKEQVPAYRRASNWIVPSRAIGTQTEWTGLKSVVVTDKDGKKHQCGKITDVFGTGNLRVPIVEPKP